MTPMPHRPWIRDDVPLVWRTDTSIEMGWPPTSVRVEGVERSDVTWLLGLRGDRTMAEAFEAGDANGMGRATMRRLVRAAARSGLLDDASTLPQALRHAPVTLRDQVAGDLAAARQIYGTRASSVFDRRWHTEVGISGANPLADTVATVLANAGVGHIVRTHAASARSRRLRKTSADRACDIICDGAHPDSVSHADAMALDIPHLPVSVAGARAVIGPMVIPGRTSCLRCRDLHLTDADPTWPRVAVQWSARRVGAVSPALAHLAGAWTALQVLALIDAGPRDVSAPTVDGALVVALPDARPIIEPRPPHPLCGCRWPHTGRGLSA